MTLLDQNLKRLFAPELRGYLVTAAAALAVVFAVKFDDGVAAAGVPLLCGVAGLLLRWTAMPVVYVITLCYFIVFPIGLPAGGVGGRIIRASYFLLNDLLLVAAALTYLHCQFRLFSLNQQAVPKVNPGEEPQRRRPGSIEANERWRLAIVIALAVIFGQLAWLAITSFEFHYGGDALVRLRPSVAELRDFRAARSMQSLELSRLMVFALGGFALVGLAGFALWYWRLATLTPADARLILMDTGWAADRRELARVETWRAARRGAWHPPRLLSDRHYRNIVRAIVIAMAVAFLAWILWVRTQY